MWQSEHITESRLRRDTSLQLGSLGMHCQQISSCLLTCKQLAWSVCCQSSLSYTVVESWQHLSSHLLYRENCSAESKRLVLMVIMSVVSPPPPPPIATFPIKQEAAGSPVQRPDRPHPWRRLRCPVTKIS